MRAWHLPPLWLAAALGLALAGRAGAQNGDVSPFLPLRQAGAAAGQAPDGSSYELRGIMSIGGVMRFCIYDPAKKASEWVGVNESGNSFVVKSADPDRDTVTLQAADGRRLTLALREGKVSPSGGARPGVAGAPATGAAANTVLSPTPEDNQKRLQSIAEEVRRRRLARMQAQQSGGAPAGQPPAPRQQ